VLPKEILYSPCCRSTWCRDYIVLSVLKVRSGDGEREYILSVAEVPEDGWTTVLSQYSGLLRL
jgi:hypothetical protein